MKLGKFSITGKTWPDVVWRARIFVIALVLLLVVTTRWTSWQGAPGWQATDDAYLQADLTPIAARVSGYPRVTLTGFYGAAATSISDRTRNAGLTLGAGPSVSSALPNQAGARARIHEAKAGAADALASFDSTVLQALRETETALASYGAEPDHRLGDAQDNARRAFEIARDQFRAGSASTLDLLTAEQTLVGADAAVAASDAALAQDQITVFKALGGGWRTPRDG